MKLLEQILHELGADTLKSITLVPGSCCYLKSVKQIVYFSPERIVLSLGKTQAEVEGEGLEVGQYFEGDVLICGNVRGVKVG